MRRICFYRSSDGEKEDGQDNMKYTVLQPSDLYSQVMGFSHEACFKELCFWFLLLL